jgi:hypothetical protein
MADPVFSCTPARSTPVDFPSGPLAVGGDYIRETDVLEHGDARLRILSRFDCVRDRLAHFYHWNDFTALNAAVAVAAQNAAEIDLNRLRSWTKSESARAGKNLHPKVREFEQRLRATAPQRTRP